MIMPVKTWMRKYVLVDIDTQKHFFNDAGIVCVRNHRRVLANILRIIKWARLSNVRAVSTVQILPDQFPCCSRRIPEIDARSKITYTFRKRFTSFDAEDRTDLMPRILDYYDQVIFEKRSGRSPHRRCGKGHRTRPIVKTQECYRCRGCYRLL
jgi:nicotinamidase-related amidase